LKEAQEMQQGSEAIHDFYQRQQRGELGAYKPFAPLSETLRNFQMHRMPADSST
jgi:hypothetical protein